MSRGGLYWVGLGLCLLLGVWLRFAGLTRGASDFAVPGQFEYYQFHPDEASLVRAAIAPIAPFDPPFTAYGLLPVTLYCGYCKFDRFFADFLRDEGRAPVEQGFGIALVGC